jgi:8-oxo-dGTP diphosphatase
MIHVAIGVIFNSLGQVLVALRPQNTHLGGLWEFPGGKREADENIFETLQRELYEELGIKVQDAEPFLRKEHRYIEYDVLLDIWRVTLYTGIPTGCEGQRIAWHFPNELNRLPFPEANQIIITALHNYSASCL